MNKYALCLASIITMTTISLTAHAKDNDPLFIKQDKYDSWLLSEYYNTVSLTSIKGSSPVTIELKPYGYSLIINVIFDNTQKQLPQTIELDVGDFTTEITRVKQSQTYTTTLEPMPALTIINSLKDNKNITLYTNNDKTINIPLNGIKKAMETIENFAKDHYITLPQPFSQKLDIYTTISIPDTIPFDLYPLYRQQSYFHDICNKQDKDKKKDQNQQNACKQEENLINLMKQNGICRTESTQLAQSFMQTTKVSYNWVVCPKK
ncbi:hypothetical protein CIN_15790 [Commensalibacter intestini A911]|uniref:Uncharacterized protein n=2 Tax=Commensalibacter intestini TaxID=479936 RepID=A0A251ZVK4_9PROT|nr:hypothetical protein [Commensalibacter intestini]EHD13387.1 hypothetical protein CIN_15790 [Commensalibacter intestini A911]OUI78705.1 hypothetical protein HK18_07415 [Commensalibacter intestini]